MCSRVERRFKFVPGKIKKDTNRLILNPLAKNLTVYELRQKRNLRIICILCYYFRRVVEEDVQQITTSVVTNSRVDYSGSTPKK